MATNARQANDHYKEKSWMKIYKKADKLTQMSMIGKVAGIQYGELMRIKIENPMKYARIQMDVISKMDK